ncbi:MAG: 50S ribosomal protein L1 [candidate division WOR-3 bacterium]|nr:50S ribosomal protein L1 [candidate division WOR-3 bacterium]MCX7947542.1 50S ribosomal protein L1 [candidate division WOR-3 bacterium]MDW8150428.1 50S ribosomal protein L1 [candidate division WOR-3 bacterium]
MAKRGKRYLNLLKKYDILKEYTLKEAVEIVKSLNSAKFEETVELSIKTNLDPTKADQIIRGAVVLPYGRGKKVRVLAIVRDIEKEKEAKEAGADYVGFSEYLEKIKEGWLEFDAVVATPDVMPELGKLGKILGPRGLMPSPKTGTVTNEIRQVVSELKKGRIEYKLDKSANLHLPVGKASFPSEHLYENILAVFEEIIKNKPPGAKGSFIKSAHISLTMSPSIKISLNDIFKTIKERTK